MNRINENAKQIQFERLTFRPEPNGRVYANVPAPVAINRLAEYEEAEEQGRIWVASPELKADIDELLSSEDDKELAAFRDNGYTPEEITDMVARCNILDSHNKQLREIRDEYWQQITALKAENERLRAERGGVPIEKR